MQIQNFIGISEEVLSAECCDDIIKCCDKKLQSSELSHMNFGDCQFPEGKLGRHDYQLYLHEVEVKLSCGNYALNKINKLVMDEYDKYSEVISSVKSHVIYSPYAKFQHTPISGGYSRWHHENGSACGINRVAVWTLYLNDVDNGGETEFLYQGLRMKPKAGTLVIWPAGYTHPHRGNPPYSNDKYIITGWYQQPPDSMSLQAMNELKAIRSLDPA